MTLYRYRIKTLDGRTIETTAPDGATALQQTGIDRAEVRPWYPFALAVVPDPQEQAELERSRQEAGKRLAEINRERRRSRETMHEETTEQQRLF